MTLFFSTFERTFFRRKGVEPGTPEFQLAMRSAQEAVSLRPRLSGARTVLAKLYLQAGNYREAVEQCRKALVAGPEGPDGACIT